MPEPISPSHQFGSAFVRNEWSALLECASPGQDRQRLASLRRSWDWARLFILAEEHGVSGHLMASLRGLEEDLVPPEIRQTLVDRQRAQNVFTLRMTAELFRILERFTSQGIAALVLKGPVLAFQPYADPPMPPYLDPDLLVPHRPIR